jgi:glycosyltransferase involved in cell wall biosynthesis
MACAFGCNRTVTPNPRQLYVGASPSPPSEQHARTEAEQLTGPTERPKSKNRTYLFVVPWTLTEVGGVNQVILNLCRQFESGDKYSPKILVSSWDYTRSFTSNEQGRSVSYMRLRGPIESSAAVSSLAKWAVFLLPELIRVARYLRANSVSHVNVHYPALSALHFVFVRALFRRRLRLILSLHGLALAKASHTVGLERWMWRFLLRSADAVVSCSDAHKKSLLAFAPAVGARATTIHNGVDIDHLMSSRNLGAEIDDRLKGRSFILSVATYEAKKGLDTLLCAFKAVRSKHGIDANLALVGPDRGMGSELRRLAHELQVSDYVVFCGEVPHSNLHAYYKAANVFCLPSRAEPFGIVLLEAAAFRCPVVATSVGGIPEILQHGVNARLVPPDDAAALAAQLQRLLRDRNESSRLANALFEHVKIRFPWLRAYKSYVKVCEET